MTKQLVALLIFLLVFVSCGGEEPSEATPTESAQTSGMVIASNDDSEADDAESTATIIPEPTEAEPTEIPPVPTQAPSTATPIPVAAISASEQTLGESGDLVIDEVVVIEDGWLILSSDNNGAAGETLRAVPLPAGTYTDLDMGVDPLRATNTLHIQLRGDAEVGDNFNPAIDELVIAETFPVSINVSLPVILANQQDINESGQVLISEVISPSNGWLVLHADYAGKLGEVVGHTYVGAGTSINVAVPVNWRTLPSFSLRAMLYKDAGAEGRFELNGADEPIYAQGKPIATTFSVSTPIDVVARNQPVDNGVLVIDRAVSKGTGWLVVYDSGQELGNIAGFALVEDGLNRNIEVEVDPSLLIDDYYIILHEDTGLSREFGFPVNDPQIRNPDGSPLLFPMKVQRGLSISGSSNGVVGNFVELDMVIVDKKMWVVIHDEPVAENGRLLGFAPVEVGVNLDIPINLNAQPTGDAIYAVLYDDQPNVGEFRPDGNDRVIEIEDIGVIQLPIPLK